MNLKLYFACHLMAVIAAYNPYLTYNSSIVTHPITHTTYGKTSGSAGNNYQTPWKPVDHHLSIRPSRTQSQPSVYKAKTALIEDKSTGRVLSAAYGLYHSRPAKPKANRYRVQPRRPRNHHRTKAWNPFQWWKQAIHPQVQPSKTSRRQDEADDRQLFVPGNDPGLPPGQLIPIGVPSNSVPPPAPSFVSPSKK